MRLVTKDTEIKLLETVEGLKQSPYNCYAVSFNLSKLEERYRSAFQVTVASNIINDIFRNEEGAIFVFNDGDIYVIYMGSDQKLIEKCIYQLRYLFSDDPLAYVKIGVENHEFCRMFMLRYQWHEFFALCKRKYLNGHNIPTPEGEEKQEFHKLTLGDMLTIEDNLKTVEISNAIRNQPACALTRNKQFKPVFYEYYVSISHLRYLLGDRVDLQSDDLLFRYLTRMLDSKVLDLMLFNYKQYLNGSISLNFNIQTVLGDRFAEFDMLLDESQKSLFVIEFDITDIFHNLTQFFHARDFLQSKGYRVCLDNLDCNSFLHIKRNHLGFDLAKLKWNSQLEMRIEMNEYDEIKDSLLEYNANRIILSRTDSPKAVEYGELLGISLYQGWHIDKLLKTSFKTIKSAL